MDVAAVHLENKAHPFRFFTYKAPHCTYFGSVPEVAAAAAAVALTPTKGIEFGVVLKEKAEHYCLLFPKGETPNFAAEPGIPIFD